MTGEDIILRFELQVDDASELSSDESLALLNQVYSEVQDDRPWEWLKTVASGTTSTSVPYIALPADFKLISPNKDNESVIFVGTDFQEYKVVSFSNRRDYRNQDGFCYIDIPNSRLYFTLQPTAAKAVEYDYIKKAAAITTSTAPLVTTDSFGSMLAYGMAAKFPSIEQADKGTSYATSNQTEFRNRLSDFAVEDANIKLAQS
jgi:hypothetical protein